MRAPRTPPVTSDFSPERVSGHTGLPRAPPLSLWAGARRALRGPGQARGLAPYNILFTVVQEVGLDSTHPRSHVIWWMLRHSLLMAWMTYSLIQQRSKLCMYTPVGMHVLEVRRVGLVGL